MTLKSTCKDIKSLKIQGAISVAIQGAEAFYQHVKNSKPTTPANLFYIMKKAAKMLVETRPTEPALRNALSYYFFNLNLTSIKNIFTHLDLKHHEIMNHFKDAKNKIIEYGVRKIKKGMIVYTHCHSSIVCDILIGAKKKGIKFEVYNTETRPLYQGRKTAIQLTKAKIPVTHFIDSAARYAIKKADIVLLGADAITTTKVYNKVGSETIALLATSMVVPVYCCTDSWKFDPDSIFGFDEEIENRTSKEVWKNPPKKVKIYNYAFDQIDPEYITGIISEIGVYGHSIFVDEVHKVISKRNLRF